MVMSIPKSSSSHLLELPSKDGRIKSPARGSWPGPAKSNNLMDPDSVSFMSAEHSKSEQQLPNEQSFMESGRLSVASCINSSRKNSGDSNYYSSGEINPPRQILPPSKSEETLFAIKKKGPSNLHHRKRNTTASSASQSFASRTTTTYSINAELLNVNVVQNETPDRSMAAPKLLVSPSSSIFSTKLNKKNSKKHLLEPTDET